MFAILKLQKKGFQNAVKINTADSVKEHFKHSEQLDDDIRYLHYIYETILIEFNNNQNIIQIKLYRW